MNLVNKISYSKALRWTNFLVNVGGLKISSSNAKFESSGIVKSLGPWKIYIQTPIGKNISYFKSPKVVR